jgi:hypothetical protein
MQFDEALRAAEKTLTKGLDLDEIKEIVRDLRALTPDSPLAERIEAKVIETERWKVTE